MSSLMDAVDVDPRSVEPQAQAVVTVARTRKDPELLGLSLRLLAATFRARWDDSSARPLLDEAVRITRRHSVWDVAARVLASRASVLHDLGDARAAARDLDAAIVAMSRAPEVQPAERARFLGRVGLSLAIVEQHAGRLEESEQRYRSLLAAGGLEPRSAAIATNNLALVLAERGEYEEAIRTADAAVALATSQVPTLEAPLVQTRAWIAVRAGRLQEGMADFERSARAYLDAGIPLGEYYTEYADAMTDLRLLPEAAAAAARAVDELAAAGLGLMLTEAQLRLARIRLLTERHEEAGELADEAARAARQQHRATWAARAQLIGVEARLQAGTAGLEQLAVARRAAARLEGSGDLHSAVEAYLVAGRVALDLSRPRSAMPALTRARALAGRGQVLVRLRGRLAGALAERAAGRPAAVLAECRAGLRDLAVHRSALPTIELRALASGHGAELGEIGLGVVLAEASPARTLAWMERTRAAALSTRLPFSDVPLADRLPGATSGPPEAVRAAAASPRGADVRVPVVDWSLGHDGVPAMVALPRVPGIAATRAALDGRTLVEFGRFAGRLVAVVVEPRRARIVELGAVEDIAAELRPLLFALRRLANPRGSTAAEAARISADLRIARLRALLVAPLGVDPRDELVVVPVGLLHGVPWSCLHDGPLAQAPSATFWVRTRRSAQARAGQGGTVLVAGPDLAGAREEVEALRAVHAGARVLSGEHARAQDVLTALADADLAHLACHGSPRADNPMFSSLRLADGPVTVQELHGAGVAPHRLVLASCHAGADVAYAGDEVLGFVSAMLAQGTAGAVASIAAVPDVAAVDLMLELHRGVRRGLTLARALHEARGRIDRDSPEGFVNWCTFSAHGAA
ncbi:CHAT domain-containing protein [Cellulomonas fengjieae]|uniref:CHAT domain-containing protein n=1 Tax=Cellulomonas fengjieae TaxID=2819978 RepID=UPI001AAEE249|nr:CHAT domain-containing tetratricopeptide repeat protein [Cellulomonas fengjieae]MBO3101709.1 CHAT domain-containing protein [Cellulomonas fengjieae]